MIMTFFVYLISSGNEINLGFVTEEFLVSRKLQIFTKSELIIRKTD
jgi:hypothetical protein